MDAEGIDADRLIRELDALIGAAPARAQDSPAAASSKVALLEPPAPAPPLPAVGAAARGARVAVVDDSKDFRKLMRAMLEGAGYEVVEAADGRQALALAQSGVCELMLLDFDMPNANGYEVVEQLRSRDETRSLPIVMLTGAPNRRQLRDLNLDIGVFLEKPSKNADILEAVAKLIGRVPPRLPSGAAPASVSASPPAPERELPETEALDEGADLLLSENNQREEEEDPGLDVMTADSPLIARINRVLVKAVEMGASDIHIEPREKELLVRVRVDGLLRPLCRLSLALRAQVAARLKIMSNLIITERRRPQDGQIRAMIKGKKIEFRVSTIPSIHGEKIVMRVLGGAKLKEHLNELGVRPRDGEAMERALESPHGLILVTGPTGSGKTTTLYTMLRMLNDPEVNIMTVEDPVEYELDGITQVHVRANIGLTFESALRAFLRQDPDIMLVGEIRDKETAEIAVKASITGHLVLSTLHTNSAPAAVTRICQMGVEPFLVADSVKLIVAQRLVRRLCPACRRPAKVSQESRRLLGEAAERLESAQEPVGCPACEKSGYAGRMPIFEVMELRTTEMRELILSTRAADAIGRRAAEEGMVGLRESAIEAVAEGKTSVQEALSLILGE